MLKIKDNVDLKELGFVEERFSYRLSIDKYSSLMVDKKSRELGVYDAWEDIYIGIPDVVYYMFGDLEKGEINENNKETEV